MLIGSQEGKSPVEVYRPDKRTRELSRHGREAAPGRDNGPRAIPAKFTFSSPEGEERGVKAQENSLG